MEDIYDGGADTKMTGTVSQKPWDTWNSSLVDKVPTFPPPLFLHAFLEVPLALLMVFVMRVIERRVGKEDRTAKLSQLRISSIPLLTYFDTNRTLATISTVIIHHVHPRRHWSLFARGEQRIISIGHFFNGLLASICSIPSIAQRVLPVPSWSFLIFSSESGHLRMVTRLNLSIYTCPISAFGHASNLFSPL